MDKKLKNYIVQLVLRRGTLKWGPRGKALKKGRRELPRKINKNGKPSKKIEYEYQCAICAGWFRGKQVEIDHVEPICPVDKSYDELSLDTIVERMYCGESGWQVLCSEKPSSCHKLKNFTETQLRAYHREKRKK